MSAAAGKATQLNPKAPAFVELGMRAKTRQRKTRKSGSARFQTSKQAVDETMLTVLGGNETQRHDRVVLAAFGSWETVVCPGCGTIDAHVWRSAQRRWRCLSCDKSFSVTSDTILADRKATWAETFVNLFTWCSASAAIPSLQLRRVGGLRYQHTWVFAQKCREACSVVHNVGFLAGELEFDGGHVLGRQAAKKRGKPQATPPAAMTPEEALAMLQERMDALVQSAAKKAPRIPFPENPSRRILLIALSRHGALGKGARNTRVRVGKDESQVSMGAMAQHYADATNSTLNTDGSPAYAGQLAHKFLGHNVVDHSAMLVGTSGEHTNNAENASRRGKRQERTHIRYSQKYANEYASELAWRCDVWRLSTGQRFSYLLGMLLRTPMSPNFRGFVHGHHRTTEIQWGIGEVEVAHSNPAKGADPISQLCSRPPR